MKKQNKKQPKKAKNFVQRTLDWFAVPVDKNIKLPAEKIAVNALEYDLLRSCLVVSVLINLAVYITWLLVQTGDISLTALINWLFV